MAMDSVQLSIVRAQIGVRAWNLHECNVKWTPKPGQLDKVVNPPAGVAPIRSS